MSPEMQTTPLTVTVCIPVWNAEAFVQETLESVRAQTLTTCQLLISVDKSDDNSLAMCRDFAASDARFTVVGHGTRLGWIGNVNWLLRHITSELACVLPHDDVLAPSYLERLSFELNQRPDAVLAFSDMETFGLRSGIRSGPPATGDLFTRLVNFLYENTAAEAWRGIFRTAAVETVGALEEGSGAAADQTWLLQLAVAGELIRVPEVLYRKRLHAGSVVAQSLTSHGQPADSHWADHCVSCHRIALAAGAWTQSEAQAIAAAALVRALRLRNIAGAGARGKHVLPRVVALASDYMLRLSGLTPVGADVMTVSAVPEGLRAHLESTVARVMG